MKTDEAPFDAPLPEKQFTIDTLGQATVGLTIDRNLLGVTTDPTPQTTLPPVIVILHPLLATRTLPPARFTKLFEFLPASALNPSGIEVINESRTRPPINEAKTLPLPPRSVLRPVGKPLLAPLNVLHRLTKQVLLLLGRKHLPTVLLAGVRTVFTLVKSPVVPADEQHRP